MYNVNNFYISVFTRKNATECHSLFGYRVGMPVVLNRLFKHLF